MLDIVRGATYAFTLTHNHYATPVSLAGGEIVFVVKSKAFDDVADDTSALIYQVGVLSDQTLYPGQVTFTVVPNNTLNDPNGKIIPVGKAYYGFKVKHSDGTQLIEGKGSFKITGSPANKVL